MSDPAKYRTRTELEQRKQQDPITVVRERLLGRGVGESTLDDIDLAVDEEIDTAVRFAEESEPAREDVMVSAVLAPEGDS
jgi:TPP-dependent pyruvate/acetoin dehydrogenase alpha subunit